MIIMDRTKKSLHRHDVDGITDSYCRNPGGISFLPMQLFAAISRVRILVHWLALVPTVSPPFALALSMILLFGRNGLITHKILGIEFVQGMNDIYGLDGLVIVQTITFFSVSYLMLKAMLERLNPAMEEAAASLGAGSISSIQNRHPSSAYPWNCRILFTFLC